MLFPSFDAFLSELGESGEDYILNSHFDEIAGKYDLTDPNFLSVIVSKCVVCSVESTIDLLRRYHCWLAMNVANAPSAQKDE